MNTVTKHTHVAIKTVDEDRRRFKFVASQQRVDRDGDVILVDGIDLSEYQKNAVLLVDHDRTFVFGKTLALHVERRADGDALVGEAEALPAGTSARVDEAWTAVKNGARNGISIGFLALEYDRRPVLDGQTGITFRKVKLLEVSSVALPACPTCVVEAKAWRDRSRAVDVVVDLDEAAPACACGGAHADEVEARDVQAVYREALAASVRDAVRRLRSEPFEPTVDVTREELGTIMRAAVRQAVSGVVQAETTAAFNRARGRID
jgi:HK97 family phage prohead protease